MPKNSNAMSETYYFINLKRLELQKETFLFLNHLLRVKFILPFWFNLIMETNTVTVKVKVLKVPKFYKLFELITILKFKKGWEGSCKAATLN